VVGNDGDESRFDEEWKRMYGYRKTGKGELEIVCCDAGVTRTALAMTNGERRGHVVVV